jgi:GWxTD domain-containing protein
MWKSENDLCIIKKKGFLYGENAMIKKVVPLLLIIFVISCASIPKNVTPSEEEFLSYVRYIITAEERQEFLSFPMGSAERENSIQEFWIKRDPTPNTPRNEFKETYFERIEAANKLFRGSRPGWLTDRGMIYILLGPPDDREDYPMGKSSEEKPIDVWIYTSLPGKSRLRLEFIDYTNTNNFTLATNITPQTINSFIREGMHLSNGIQSISTEISSRKSPEELKLDQIQETDKTLTKSQQLEKPREGQVDVTYRELKIPTELAAIFTQNISSRNPRSDIAISHLRTLFLPAQQNNVHAVFLFKIKSSDLDFLIESEESNLVEESASGVSRSKLDVFIRIHTMEKGSVKDILKEIYVPYSPERDQKGIQSDQEHLYTICNPLPPGDYLLALAFATPNLSKIGTTYIEFSLPKASSFSRNLDTTPVFFVESLQKMPEPEMEVALHRDYFRYSILKIKPKEKNIFSPGETADIFYFIYGARPNKDKKFQIQVDYAVKKDKETLREYPTRTYESPFVSQPLPLVKEGQELEKGEYILEIKIRDNVSQLSIIKDIQIEIR